MCAVHFMPLLSLYLQSEEVVFVGGSFPCPPASSVLSASNTDQPDLFSAWYLLCLLNEGVYCWAALAVLETSKL